MARAAAYDQYEDPGMAFSSQELADYLPGSWAEERVYKLLEIVSLAKRRSEIPGTNPEWWKEVAKSIPPLMRWYCIAIEIDSLAAAEYELPDPRSKAGKVLTHTAQSLTERGFLANWQTDAEASMRYVVTIGRRAQGASKAWGKSEGRLSNKLANCVQRELSLCAKLEQGLDSRSVETKES